MHPPTWMTRVVSSVNKQLNEPSDSHESVTFLNECQSSGQLFEWTTRFRQPVRLIGTGSAPGWMNQLPVRDKWMNQSSWFNEPIEKSMSSATDSMNQSTKSAQWMHPPTWMTRVVPSVNKQLKRLEWIRDVLEWMSKLRSAIWMNHTIQTTRSVEWYWVRSRLNEPMVCESQMNEPIVLIQWTNRKVSPMDAPTDLNDSRSLVRKQAIEWTENESVTILRRETNGIDKIAFVRSGCRSGCRSGAGHNAWMNLKSPSVEWTERLEWISKSFN